MKHFFLFVALCLIAITTEAGDILTLNNQQKFMGKVIRIEKCSITFRSNGERYEIPASDIWTIEFGDLNDRIYTRYLDMTLTDPDACLKGRTDAESFHGKAGLHVALGVLFGPFAVIGSALGSPTPSSGKETMVMSQNKDLFGDAVYLDCYKKKARARNTGNAAIGWLAWVLLVVL